MSILRDIRRIFGCSNVDRSSKIFLKEFRRTYEELLAENGRDGFVKKSKVLARFNDHGVMRVRSCIVGGKVLLLFKFWDFLNDYERFHKREFDTFELYCQDAGAREAVRMYIVQSGGNDDPNGPEFTGLYIPFRHQFTDSKIKFRRH